MKHKTELKIRVYRNKFILEKAQEAAKTLVKHYRKTLSILTKYIKTKDLTILMPKIEDRPPSIDDADKYFEVGNWAHPLLEARRLPLNKETKLIFARSLADRAKKLLNAEDDKRQAIKDRKPELLKYNAYIEESKDLGFKHSKFEEALKLLRKAHKLFPDKPEALWGIATAYHHIKDYWKSIQAYKKLIRACPDNPKFRYELGQVQIKDGLGKEDNEMILKGLSTITKAMEDTKEFDHFLDKIATLYYQTKYYKEALSAYRLYLKRFPADYNAWVGKGDCLMKLKLKDDARIAYKRAKAIKPELDLNEIIA
jgi:tetratricopeptide (TPR) repeat protein